MSYSITDEGTFTSIILDRSPSENIYWAFPKEVRLEILEGILSIYYDNTVQKIPREYIQVPTSTSDEDLFDQLAFMVGDGGGGTTDTNLGNSSLVADGNRVFDGSAFNLGFSNVGDFSIASNNYMLNVGGDSTNIIVVKATPPANTSFLWQNSTSNEIYEYDGVNWVSITLYSILFTDSGGTTNNTFLVAGGVRTTLARGWTVPFDMKIQYASWKNGTGNIVQYFLYVNGAPIGSIPTTAADRGTSNANPANLTINAGATSFVSVQYQGTTTNNVFLEIFYRKIGA